MKGLLRRLPLLVLLLMLPAACQQVAHSVPVTVGSSIGLGTFSSISVLLPREQAKVLEKSIRPRQLPEEVICASWPEGDYIIELPDGDVVFLDAECKVTGSSVVVRNHNQVSQICRGLVVLYRAQKEGELIALKRHPSPFDQAGNLDPAYGKLEQNSVKPRH